MSKEADIKVVRVQTHVLKVYIHCYGCKQEVKKLLHKIEGVYSIDIDAEQGKVTVLGNVDPNTLIKKLQKKGKNAVLCLSKGGNPQLDKQFQALQINDGEGPKGGKPKKGGKDQKGQQQQQLIQKIKGLKDMKLPQFKDMKPLPTKSQKSVKFNLPEDDGDVTDDGFDDDCVDDDDDMYDDGFDGDDFDMDPNELKAHLKKAAMSQQNAPMGAPQNGKKGGAGDVQVQNKAMVGTTDAKNSDSGKKGGQSQGGGAGVAKNAGKNGGVQDHKSGGNGGTGNNRVATNGGNNNAASGGKKAGGGGGGGWGGKNDMGQPMPMDHGFHGMDLSGVANVGQMGNVPMGQMGNIPVQGLPTMTAGGYFQGAGPELPAGNPYYQQQYAAAMMRQNEMYARARYPVAYMPQPPATESCTNLFSDENPNSCTIM